MHVKWDHFPKFWKFKNEKTSLNSPPRLCILFLEQGLNQLKIVKIVKAFVGAGIPGIPSPNVQPFGSDH